MDQNKRVSFVHDIKLVDGIYLLSSILDYNNVISTLNQGGGPTYYTAAAGDTVQTVVDNTGVSWDTLAALNPDLTGTDEVLDEGNRCYDWCFAPGYAADQRGRAQHLYRADPV